MTTDLTIIPGGNEPPVNPEAVSIGIALARLIGEMPSIGKDERSEDSYGGYRYRGIEQITREVQPLLAKHGIVVVPQARLLSHTPAAGMRDNWTDMVLEVTWKVIGPDGTWLEARTIGVGRDGGDKGANKAMTQAYKYLWLDLLCICDAEDDTDGNNYDAHRATEGRSTGSGGRSSTKPTRRTQGTAKTSESDSAPPAERPEPTYRTAQEAAMRAALNALTKEARKLCIAAFKEKFGTTLSDLSTERHQEAAEWLSDYLADAPPAPEGGDAS